MPALPCAPSNYRLKALTRNVAIWPRVTGSFGEYLEEELLTDQAWERIY